MRCPWSSSSSCRCVIQVHYLLVFMVLIWASSQQVGKLRPLSLPHVSTCFHQNHCHFVCTQHGRSAAFMLYNRGGAVWGLDKGDTPAAERPRTISNPFLSATNCPFIGLIKQRSEAVDSRTHRILTIQLKWRMKSHQSPGNYHLLFWRRVTGHQHLTMAAHVISFSLEATKGKNIHKLNAMNHTCDEKICWSLRRLKLSSTDSNH